MKWRDRLYVARFFFADKVFGETWMTTVLVASWTVFIVFFFLPVFIISKFVTGENVVRLVVGTLVLVTGSCLQWFLWNKKSDERGGPRKEKVCASLRSDSTSLDDRGEEAGEQTALVGSEDATYYVLQYEEEAPVRLKRRKKQPKKRWWQRLWRKRKVLKDAPMEDVPLESLGLHNTQVEFLRYIEGQYDPNPKKRK